MTPNELVSIAANNVGDGGFVLLNRDEYLQFANDVAHDLWSKSRACHVIREYPLPAGAYYFDLPDTDILNFASMQIRTKASPTGPGDPTGSPEPSIIPVEGDAYLTDEKPAEQAVRQHRGLYQSVGDTQPHLSVTPEFRGGRFRIHAAFAFESGWVLALHCVVTSPLYVWLDKAVTDPTAGTTVDYEDQEVLWEPFRNLFIEGVTWRAARRINVTTKDPVRARSENDARQLYYSHYLPDAVHYVNSLKDGASVLKVEPFRWLDE